MKLKNVILLLLLLCMSCNKKTGCEEIKEIYVNPALINEKNDYCVQLSKAILNEDYFLNFLKIEVNENNSFHHGEVLVQLVEYKGQEYFIRNIKSLNRSEKFRLRVYLGAGFTKTKIKKFKAKQFGEVYPELKKALLLE